MTLQPMTLQKHIVFVSFPLLGHMKQMLAIAEELVDRGRQVSFVINDDGEAWVTQTGAQFIAWSLPADSADVIHWANSMWQAASQTANPWQGDLMMLKQMVAVYAPLYHSLAAILQAVSPDLLVLDRAVLPAMDLAQQYQIPYIIQTRFLGNFVKLPARAPQFGTGHSQHMSFWERCLNRIAPVALQTYLLPTLLQLNRVRRECADDRQVHDPFANRITIVGNTFDIEIFRSLPNYVHLVGPIFARAMPTLPESLQDWLDEAQFAGGAIYVSFGTLATLQAWQVQALLEGLTQTGLQVLWSMPTAQQFLLPSLPASVRVESFVPQFSVLSHPAVRLFVSHCGMNSILEALYWQTPILALPFFGDQPDNAARLVDIGVARRLHKQQFGAAEVSAKVEDLLHNPEVQSVVDRVSSNFRQANGRDQAADIVEAALMDRFMEQQ